MENYRNGWLQARYGDRALQKIIARGAIVKAAIARRSPREADIVSFIFIFNNYYVNAHKEWPQGGRSEAAASRRFSNRRRVAEVESDIVMSQSKKGERKAFLARIMDDKGG